MSSPERWLNTASFAAYVAAAVAILLIAPNERSVDPLLVAGLVAAYVVVSRVRFEFGTAYNNLEQIALVPLLLLAPLPLVPLLVALAALGSQLPELIRGTWARDRWTTPIADSWLAIGPTLVLVALAPGMASVDHAWIYALAYLAQLGGDLAWGTIRERVLDRLPFGGRIPYMRIWRNFFNSSKLDMLLSPLLFAIAVESAEAPVVLLTLAPLVLILHVLSQDRRERFGKTLELQRAYRGTVMLLSDVVEFDDSYTADHSRSVVDLVNAVADQMQFDPAERQELEFAALLHDVGKIAVPKDILNKPARLTMDEFEVMKRHTIEGQTMLDRVGGLLGRVGEIVRSCHERWDGGGYPDGLAGEEIPLASRVVFACDAYNAMTTDRVYRRGMSSKDAVNELAANSGAQFDPTVVQALVDVVENDTLSAAQASPADEIRALLSERALGEGIRTASAAQR